MRYLEAEEILAIHDSIVDLVGGIKGIRDLNLLYSIAQKPRMAMMGKEFYPTLFAKAAAYLEATCTYHIFADGNKRTAIAITQFFLQENGFKLHATEDETYTTILKITQKKILLEEASHWLKKKSRRMD